YIRTTKDNDIIQAMDPTEDRRYIRIKKRSESRSEALIPVERFGELFDQISDLLKKMGDELHGGKVAKNPIRIGSKYCSCDKCDLKYYCRHPEPRNVFAAEEGEP
ncbi:MAG: hypothetical protein IJC19_08020, partial [Clostridia bacterium]|nr:hypothetical protein [Clostridia bacterium]